jgi:hypothetical protein
MPYTRNSRGRRAQVVPASLAAMISKAYQDALGPVGTMHARPEILEHARSVLKAMGAAHGEGVDHEWPPEALQAMLIERLQSAPLGVLEVFLQSQGINKSPASIRSDKWDNFHAQPQRPDIDPIWDLRRVHAGEKDTSKIMTNLETLGGPQLRSIRKSAPPARAPWRRSHWISFWEKLAAQHPRPVDASSLRSHLLFLPSDEHRRTVDGWWIFWNDLLHELVPRSPVLLDLIQILHQRRSRAALFGQPWLCGMPGSAELHVEFSATGEAHYRRSAAQHLQEIFSFISFDEAQWLRFTRIIEPRRDHAVPWQGMCWMEEQGGLWPVRSEGASPAALEPPQWAYARLALALASEEGSALEKAIEFYHALSLQEIAPCDAMLRTAGLPKPRWLEDQAMRVQDDFEDIHGAIFRSAVDTKWTGTVALDWSAVRGAGSLVAGRRAARGVLGFVRTIDAALDAQGRSPGDHPVTVGLPVWHPEVESWLTLHTVCPRVQPVLFISDAFLQCVADHGSWTLLDPSVYPECLRGTEGYKDGLLQVAARKGLHARAHRVISSARLWSRIISAVQAGGLFLTFSDADRAFAPFIEVAPPVAGLEGVGALPLPSDSRRDQRVSWPSLAVNLRATLDKHGLPVPEKMRRIVSTALRLADNMITQDPEAPPATLEYRPVCLGAVGFFEAVQSAQIQTRGQPEEVSTWITNLCQAWATTLLLADQELTRERGPSPWAIHGQSLTPAAAVARLRRSRGGSLGMQMDSGVDARFDRMVEGAQRFSVRTVWAPFESAARMAGVTPGGMGTLRPIDMVRTSQGERRVPGPLWHLLSSSEPSEDYSIVLDEKYPQSQWPQTLRVLVDPDATGWEERLRHASLVRPWIDQGVSLTLPSNIPEGALAVIIQRAWWFGLSNLRFHSPPTTPNTVAPV